MRSSLKPLGINDPDASRRDSKVVDVRTRTRDPPVVQDPQRLTSELVQPSTEFLLTTCADVPCFGGLGILPQGKDETAELRMRRAGVLLAALTSSHVLPASRCTRRTCLNRHRSQRVRWLIRLEGYRIDVGETEHRLTGSLVHGFGARRNLNTAHPAGSGVPKPQALRLLWLLHQATVTAGASSGAEIVCPTSTT